MVNKVYSIYHKNTRPNRLDRMNVRSTTDKKDIVKKTMSKRRRSKCSHVHTRHTLIPKRTPFWHTAASAGANPEANNVRPASVITCLATVTPRSDTKASEPWKCRWKAQKWIYCCSPVQLVFL